MKLGEKIQTPFFSKEQAQSRTKLTDKETWTQAQRKWQSLAKTNSSTLLLAFLALCSKNQGTINLFFAQSFLL